MADKQRPDCDQAHVFRTATSSGMLLHRQICADDDDAADWLWVLSPLSVPVITDGKSTLSPLYSKGSAWNMRLGSCCDPFRFRAKHCPCVVMWPDASPVCLWKSLSIWCCMLVEQWDGTFLYWKINYNFLNELFTVCNENPHFTNHFIQMSKKISKLIQNWQIHSTSEVTWIFDSFNFPSLISYFCLSFYPLCLFDPTKLLCSRTRHDDDQNIVYFVMPSWLARHSFCTRFCLLPYPAPLTRFQNCQRKAKRWKMSLLEGQPCTAQPTPPHCFPLFMTRIMSRRLAHLRPFRTPIIGCTAKLNFSHPFIVGRWANNFSQNLHNNLDSRSALWLTFMKNSQKQNIPNVSFSVEAV